MGVFYYRQVFAPDCTIDTIPSRRSHVLRTLKNGEICVILSFVTVHVHTIIKISFTSVCSVAVSRYFAGKEDAKEPLTRFNCTGEDGMGRAVPIGGSTMSTVIM